MKNTDFKIEYTRGSGPGGQHKNKVETCVTVIHIPTGLQERCQDTRSKIKNLEIAKDRLIKKIEKFKSEAVQETKNCQRIDRIHNGKTIRTYNYIRSQVVDHRSGIKAELKKVMNGDIDVFLSPIPN